MNVASPGHILATISQVASAYQRLVLIVGRPGSGKTAALRQVAARTGAPTIKVNLVLSRRLLELTEQQRQLQAGQVLADLVEET